MAQPEPGGPVKIGYSRVDRPSEVMRRIAVLEPGCPWPLRLIGTTKGTVYDERKLHDRFAHLRIHREWFRLEGELQLWVNGIANGRHVGPPHPAREGEIRSLRP